MANDSSLQGGAVNFAFDLDSQKGVTHLLASVRASEISPAQKNELRDLIFLYSNGGRDQSVRINLEQKISTYGVAPLPMPGKSLSAQAEKPRPVFGTSRPAPSFTPSLKVSENTIKPIASVLPPVREEVVVMPATEPVKTSVPIQAEVPTPTPAPTPVVEQQVPTPTPTPTPTATPTPIPVVEQPVPTPTPVPPVVESVSYDPNQALARIREIKSLVNDKVGNPVNLVDINNEVGREYMGALLDAMKKLNSGTSVISAMKRLETAYQLVEKTIAEHGKEVKIKEETVPAQTEVVIPQAVESEPAPVQTIPQSPVEVTEADTPAVSNVLETIPDMVAQEEIVPTPILKKIVEQQAPASVSMPRPESSQSASVNEPLKVPVAPLSSSPVIEKPTDSEIVSAWGPETDTIKHSEKKAVTPVPGKATSLAQAKVKLRTPNDLPLASSLDTSSVAGDSLFTKQVDDGLEQLLEEWSLFKKSGLFGSGPKGREHPLFKKIAGLQIPLLLAGRFEGATQEIKQSITDYMNGWRYEQGIIYEQGETFEHYLRRVIRHILDLH